MTARHPTSTLPSHRSPTALLTLARLLVLALAGLTSNHVLAASSAKREVIVVFKTHFDIGYTDMASNVVHRYRTTMIDQALQVVDRSRDLPPEQQFAWTLPGWPVTQILASWPGQSPDRQDRIRAALRQGRFVVHGLPFTTHTELLEPEDLVRGLGYSSRLARDLGLPLPRDAKMTDVPSHSWILPTLLRHAGIDFLHLGCNAASRSPEVPRVFWWEGPDGSRLLTMYTAESYGTGLVPPADWPHRTWLALIHTGDNHGPPAPEEVRQLLQDASRKLDGARVRIGRLSDFADALLAENPRLPVVRGDIPDTWIHGPMSDPSGAALARRLRPTLAATEALQTLLPTWGVTSSTRPGARLDAAWEGSLLYGEHTWGGGLYWVRRYSAADAYPYGEAWKKWRETDPVRRLECSWEEHSDYIRSADALVTPALQAALRDLATATPAQGRRIVVFNPLPWKRDDLAAFDASSDPGFSALKPLDGGHPVPISRAADHRWQFLARGLPPLGYRTFVPTSDAPRTSGLQVDAEKHTLESPAFRAVVDPSRGAIRSLVDRRSGLELVEASAPHPFGTLLYERFSRDEVDRYVQSYVKISADWATNELGKPGLPPSSSVPYRAAQPSGFATHFEESSDFVSVTFHAPAGEAVPFGVQTRLVLHRNLPFADLELTVESKPADPWPEAGWLCLPLAVHEPRFQLGRLGSIVDPAHDLVPGSNHEIFALHTGLTVRDSRGRGVGLCPLDHPLVSLGQPGGWRDSTAWTPRAPRVYVNLFNNQWTTNFRLWNSGTWSSRVRLWSCRSRQDAAAALVTPSLEARHPFLAALSDGDPGPLPPAAPGIALSRPGVLVTALRPNPDGPGTLVRLWDLAGGQGRLTLQLPEGLASGPRQIQAVDLRGQPLGQPQTRGRDRVDVQLAPYAPVTLVLPPKT